MCAEREGPESGQKDTDVLVKRKDSLSSSLTLTHVKFAEPTLTFHTQEVVCFYIEKR